MESIISKITKIIKSNNFPCCHFLEKLKTFITDKMIADIKYKQSMSIVSEDKFSYLPLQRNIEINRNELS